ncbi:MAG: DUF2911 domain-containing protein [Bacteroidia bacterium]|nr:DUF2911 domain-containing protein [Bacteroidia bacterium]
MLKKILLITAGVLIALALLFTWFKQNTKKASPYSTASFSKDGLSIQIGYCQPSAKGRVIFGEEQAGAIQPYGQYWRVGANEATTLELNGDILINGNELKAGKYALYAYPGAELWTICMNSDWDRWGATEPDPKKDVLRTEVQATNNADRKEMLQISFETGDSIQKPAIIIHWDKTLVKVPFTIKK